MKYATTSLHRLPPPPSTTSLHPQAFLDESSGAVSSLPKMVVQGFKELNLIYFFTAGETEVRGGGQGRGGDQGRGGRA